MYADQPGRRHVARVKGRTVTAAEVPQPGVPVEDGLHEWPVARSVPGGLAREGRPVAARYLFNLGEPVTTGDAELVTGGMEQGRTIPSTLVGRCGWR